MQIVTISGCRNWLAVTKTLKYNKFGCIESTTYSDSLGDLLRTEWECSFNDNWIIEISSQFTLLGWEYHSVSITSTGWDSVITIWANSVTIVEWTTVVYHSDSLLSNDISITPSVTALITRIK